MSVLYPDLNFTSFPESLDTFTQWLDITASDGPMIEQYIKAVNQGNMTLAGQILAQIPSGSQKIIKAVDLNKLSQAIQALERFYKSDVKGYIDNKQVEWLSIINQFDYKSTWSSSVAYEKTNLVSYVDFGSEYVYMAVDRPPIGAAPTNTNYWLKITVEGLQGPSGTGATYRYQWKSSEAYGTDDAVTYDGALWYALKPSKGVTPLQGSDTWRIIMTLSATAYPIQDEQPTNQSAGDLWFNTSPTPTKFYYLEKLQSPAQSDDILKGKEVYDDNGNKVVGTGTGGSVEWNSNTSPLVWNGQ